MKKITLIGLSVMVLLSGCSKKDNKIQPENIKNLNYFVPSEIPVPFDITFPLDVKVHDDTFFVKGISTATEPEHIISCIDTVTGNTLNIDPELLPDKNINQIYMNENSIWLSYSNVRKNKAGISVINRSDGSILKDLSFDTCSLTDSFCSNGNGELSVIISTPENEWSVVKYDESTFEEISVFYPEEKIKLSVDECMVDMIVHDNIYYAITEEYTNGKKSYRIISFSDNELINSFSVTGAFEGWYNDSYINSTENLCLLFTDNDIKKIYIEETSLKDGSFLSTYEDVLEFDSILISNTENRSEITYWKDDSIWSYNEKEVTSTKLADLKNHGLGTGSCSGIALYGNSVAYAFTDHKNTDAPIICLLDPEGKEKSRVYSSQKISDGIAKDIVVLSDNKYCVLENKNENNILHFLDETGNEINSSELISDNIFSEFITAGTNGEMYYCERAMDETKLYVYNSNGTLLRSTVIDENIAISDIFRYDNSDVAIYSQNNSTDKYAASVDFEKGKINTDQNFEWFDPECNEAEVTSDGTVYLKSNIGIISYSDKAKDELIKWNESDFYYYIISSNILNKDTIAGIFQNAEGNHLMMLNRADEQTISNIKSKKTIYIAGANISRKIYKLVEDYNNSSQQYRICIEDYAQYAGDDLFGGEKKLNLDIISGKVPDILLGNSELDITFYSNKKMFTDLNSFIEKDTEFKKSDYLENIIECCQNNGKQYFIPVAFEINTICGKESVLGSDYSWTFNDFLNIAENRKMFYPDLNYWILEDKLIFMCIDEFVDFDNFTCNFDNKDYIRLLDFISENGIPDNDNSYDSDKDPDYHNRFEQDLCAGEFVGFSSPRSILFVNEDITSDKLKIKGLPSSNNNGLTADLYITAAISDASESKEEAWNFIKLLLDDDFQSICPVFPVKKTTFYDLLKEDRRPVLINRADGSSYQTDPLSDELADSISDAVNNISKIINRDSKISSVIEEQINLIIAGQQTSSEAAAEIQRKVSLYLNEIK